MRRTRNAKIVATLGPSSSTEARIAELFAAGTDVFRLNFSHGTHEDHKHRVDVVRKLEGQCERPIGVMLDLQGPKLRVGGFLGGHVRLEEARPFRLDLADELGDTRRASLPHPEVFAALAPGTDLLLDDGKIRLRVENGGADYAETRVVIGGELSDNKGVNVPSAILDLTALTDKDRRDLHFGLDLGVDWIALSFVQRPDDVAEARKIIDGRAGVLVKLEKPSAIEHLDGIIELADAVMVARGDLGVELPPEDVPGLQKRIIRACRHAGKPVVVATQMLDSMIHAPTPTRAEASDVATAVYDGADAVMLSAETAAGDYPVESVCDNEPHHPPGGARPLVPHDPRGRELSSRGHRRRCHHHRRPPGGPDGVGGGHRHLHDDRFDDAAGRARATARAHPGTYPAGQHGAAAGPGLGRPFRGNRGRPELRRNGLAGRQHRRARGVHVPWRPVGGHRRGSLRYSRSHQHPAHRLGGVTLGRLPSAVGGSRDFFAASRYMVAPLGGKGIKGMTILVTGAAGFIGYHVAHALLERGERVIGLDNVDLYYEASLKEARVARLADRGGFSFERLDITDRDGVEALVGRRPEITRVVHLAAQAGVRYSLVNPHAYTRTNVAGHLVVLDACRRLDRLEHVVFASSSSVYGGARPPFSVADAVDTPISLYAASKRSAELISHAYSHLYGMPLTGAQVLHRLRPLGTARYGCIHFRPQDPGWRADSGLQPRRYAPRLHVRR